MEKHLPDDYQAGTELIVLNLESDNKNIEWNSDAIDLYLHATLEPYKDIDLFSIEVKEVKQLRASLNKLKVKSETRRIEIKKVLDQKYKQFKEKYDQVFDVLDVAIERFDKHIKTEEVIRKENKKTEIVAIYNRTSGDLKSFLSFKAIFNKYGDTWLNVKPSLQEIEGKIFEGFANIRTDLKTIDDMDSPFSIELQAEYKRGFSMTQVVQKNNDLMALKRAKDERSEKSDAERIERINEGLKKTLAEVMPTAQKIADEEMNNSQKVVLQDDLSMEPETGNKRDIPENTNVCPDEPAVNSENIANEDNGGFEKSCPAGQIVEEITFTAFFTGRNQNGDIVTVRDQIGRLGNYCKVNGIRLEVQGV